MRDPKLYIFNGQTHVWSDEDEKRFHALLVKRLTTGLDASENEEFRIRRTKRESIIEDISNPTYAERLREITLQLERMRDQARLTASLELSGQLCNALAALKLALEELSPKKDPLQ